MGVPRKYTDEEREAKKKENYRLNYKPKEKEIFRRLAPIRIDDRKLLTQTEAKRFVEEIHSITKNNFERIIGDKNLWEKINSTSDGYLEKKCRQDRRNRNGNLRYPTKEELERAERAIWGGENIPIFKEEQPDTQYETPYKKNGKDE